MSYFDVIIAVTLGTIFTIAIVILLVIFCVKKNEQLKWLDKETNNELRDIRMRKGKKEKSDNDINMNVDMNIKVKGKLSEKTISVTEEKSPRESENINIAIKEKRNLNSDEEKNKDYIDKLSWIIKDNCRREFKEKKNEKSYKENKKINEENEEVYKGLNDTDAPLNNFIDNERDIISRLKEVTDI